MFTRNSPAGLSLLMLLPLGVACSGKSESNSKLDLTSTTGTTGTTGAATIGGQSMTAASTVSTGGVGTTAGSETMTMTMTGAAGSGGSAGGPPIDVPNEPFLATEAAAGSLHVCALTPDAEVACWGQGPLGTGAERQFFPIRVPGLGSAVAIRTSAQTACVISDAGELSCWGAGAYGQLGNGESGDGYRQDRPAAVQGLPPVNDLAMSGNSVCAVVNDGSVWCWGENPANRLGFDSEPCGPYPVEMDVIVYEDVDCEARPRQVSGVSGAVQVGTNIDQQCALLEDGTVACWSANSVAPDDPVVELVSGLSDAVQLALGTHHACALKGDGSVWCWGNNSSGQLGRGVDAPTGRSSVAEPVAELGNVTQLDAGSNTTCAVTDDGSVYCWGNVQYVLADAERPNPTNAAARAPTLAPYVTDAVSVTTEGFVTCVTTSTDRAHCWGPSTTGATGNGHVEETLDYSGDPVVWAG